MISRVFCATPTTQPSFPSELHCIHLLSLGCISIQPAWERMNSWSDWNNESRDWIANKIATWLQNCRLMWLYITVVETVSCFFFLRCWFWFPMVSKDGKSLLCKPTTVLFAHSGLMCSCRGRGCLDLLRSQVAVGGWYYSKRWPWWSSVNPKVYELKIVQSASILNTSKYIYLLEAAETSPTYTQTRATPARLHQTRRSESWTLVALELVTTRRQGKNLVFQRSISINWRVEVDLPSSVGIHSQVCCSAWSELSCVNKQLQSILFLHQRQYISAWWTSKVCLNIFLDSFFYSISSICNLPVSWLKQSGSSNGAQMDSSNGWKLLKGPGGMERFTGVVLATLARGKRRMQGGSECLEIYDMTWD